MLNKLSKQDIITNFLVYILSFSFGLVLITYLLQIPHLLTGNPTIVNKYYRNNFTTNVPLDLFFVFVYFIIGLIIIKLVKATKLSTKVFIIALTTMVLTSGFCLYFRTMPLSKNFFSKWFHTVGYSSVIYDVILLSFIYLVHMKLLDYINPS